LSCEALKKLMLEALENAPGTSNPETFHARFDHLERGLQIDDVIYGIETEWKRCQPLRFNRKFWQWNYEISTESTDGERLTLIVAVDTVARTFEVITRWTENTTA
jgi:hypothetical protein